MSGGLSADACRVWRRRAPQRGAACAVALLLAAAAAADAVEPRVPQPQGPCADIREGALQVLDTKVDVVVAGTAGRPGPLILYWHGTGTAAREELQTAFDTRARRELREAGGLLVAFGDSSAKGATTSGNNVWFEGDLLVADEIVACAVQAGRADRHRIHAMGMSAGGLHVAGMSYSRAHYLASVVSLSGGHLVFHGRDSTQALSSAPDNLLAALIVHGGAGDQHILDFSETSGRYATRLRERGHGALLCAHADGHRIPAATSAAAWRFLQDHPFGAGAAYADRPLPAELQMLCTAGISLD